MRILLDENLDWRLKRLLPGHEAESVQLNGWAGIQNGKLLSLAEKSFDVFITMDGNIQFQQNYARLKLVLIALHAPSNRLADTAPLMPKVISALPDLLPGTLTIIR
jgi:predicted nuclease of predicted toxin-antitoxin system